jgi:MFS family permease
MIPIAIPKITSHFKSITHIGWYASAYLFPLASLRVIASHLYTLYSIKWTFVASLLVYGVGCAICGSAPTSTVLIIGRAVTGTGSAGIFPGLFNIAQYSITRERYWLLLALSGLPNFIAFITGPFIAGALTDRVSWRWCFYLQIPVASLAILIIAIAFKEQKRTSPPNLSWKHRLKKIDLEGHFTFIPAIACLLLVLNWAGTKYPWNDVRIIFLFILFGSLFGCFLIIQMKKQDNTIIPTHVMGRSSILAATLFSFIIGSVSEVLKYYLPVWFQAVKGASALTSGLMILPLILAVSISSILGIFSESAILINVDLYLATPLFDRVKFYALAMIACSILSAIGFSMLSRFTPQTSHSAWIGYEVLTGLGIGIGLGITPLTVQILKEPSLVSTDILKTTEIMGGAIFVSIGQCIFANVLLASGLKRFAPLIEPSTVFASGASGLENSIELPSLQGVILAYNDALIWLFVPAAVLAAMMLIGGLVIEWESVSCPNPQSETRATMAEGG